MLIPIPVSATSVFIFTYPSLSPGSSCTLIVTIPPSGVYLSALLTRLITISLTFVPSHTTFLCVTHISLLICIFFSFATDSNTPQISSSISPILSTFSSISIFPLSMRAISRTLLIMDNKSFPDCSIFF